VKAIVDKDTCTGCELCTQVCDPVFRMEDGVAVAGPVPADAEESCRQAAEDCPVGAIQVQ
jgi:ferredoxin